MKIKITIIDDNGKKHEGSLNLYSKHSVSSKGRIIEQTETTKNASYVGLTGGIKFLMSRGFFEKPQTSKDVTEEMKKEGYYHSLNSIDKILRVNFVNKKKILTRIKENNVWKYVLRK